MCRKFGQKLSLRPERCASPKCAFTRRQTVPGAHGTKRRRAPSAYGVQLQEKQRIRLVYGISEKAFKRFVRDSMHRSAASTTVRNALDAIAQQLEFRLDNVVFRMGFAPSRSVARQLVSHGHMFVNGRRAQTPSIGLRIGDVVSLRPESAKQAVFSELAQQLRKQRTPAWVELKPDAFSGKIIGLPKREEAMGGMDLAKVLEYYAR